MEKFVLLRFDKRTLSYVKEFSRRSGNKFVSINQQRFFGFFFFKSHLKFLFWAEKNTLIGAIKNVHSLVLLVSMKKKKKLKTGRTRLKTIECEYHIT